MPMDELILDDEAVLAKWRPSLLIFLSKIGAISLIATLALAPVVLWQWSPRELLLLPILVVLYFVAFDDVDEWLRRRADRWTLTDLRLIRENPKDPNSPATIMLNEIRSIRALGWWSLSIDIGTGWSKAIKYVRNPSRVRERILSARDDEEG